MIFQKIIAFSILMFNFLPSNVFSTIDLEENCDDCIISTKRIVLSQFKDAFNPSIVSYKKNIIMTFRIIPNPLLTFNSQIGIVLLNENFEPITKPVILDTQSKASLVPSRAEDARLITVNDKLFMVYSDNKDDYISRGGFRVYVSEIIFKNNSFTVGKTDCLRYFEGASNYVREKNWVPFEYNGNLLLAYSIMPHKIFSYFQGFEATDTFAQSNNKINWDFGDLRGGTPALLDGDKYISFFHSSIDMLTAHSNKRKISHYFMGAYTFSSMPPFDITSISKKPLIGKGFYKGEYYKPYWKSVRCVFPCGIIIDNSYIYVSYGRQDHEMWIVKMDKQKLLDSLETITKN